MRWQVVQVSHTGRVRRVLARDAPTEAIAQEWRAGYDLRRLEVRVQWPTLTEAQRAAVRAGGSRWLGARESGTQGSVMVALHRKGLADVEVVRRPYKRLVYRLTSDGELVRRRLRAADEIDVLYPPAVSEGVRCRCTHCGAVFEDATPGGSCGRCGQEVKAELDAGDVG